MAILQDQKAQGTDGGTSVSGWQKRVLNTSVIDDIGVSLTNSEFTLPVGTYLIQASAPAYKSNEHKIRLSSNNNSTTLLEGTSEFAIAAYQNQTRSSIDSILILTNSTTVAIWHNTIAIQSGNGLGVARGIGIEVYTMIRITKLR
jgi:hypothetical protein